MKLFSITSIFLLFTLTSFKINTSCDIESNSVLQQTQIKAGYYRLYSEGYDGRNYPKEAGMAGQSGLYVYYRLDKTGKIFASKGSSISDAFSSFSEKLSDDDISAGRFVVSGKSIKITWSDGKTANWEMLDKDLFKWNANTLYFEDYLSSFPLY